MRKGRILRKYLLRKWVEKEPVTVVCSKMGWVRSLRGHIELGQDLKFKDGDEKSFIFHAESTDRILIFGSNGRFYTIPCANLPGGRGMGEPVRLMVDLPNEVTIIDIIWRFIKTTALSYFYHPPDNKLLYKFFAMCTYSAGSSLCL